MDTKRNRIETCSFWHRMAVVALMAALGSAPAAEANWRISPELVAGISYDDNLSLTDNVGVPESDTIFEARALATFFYDAQLTDFSITPMLRSRVYKDEEELDSDDQFLNFLLTKDGQKSQFRFRGEYSREAVRTAERFDVDFDVEDPEELPADDTGLVFDTGKRKRLRLLPDFEYRFSPRTSARIRGNYRDVSYDDEVASVLRGYREYNAGLSFNYRWSEKDRISLNVAAGQVDTDGSDDASKSESFGLGYTRSLSERTEFRFLVGSNTSEDRDGVDQTNPVGEISLIHRLQTTRFFASYRRTTSGNGSVQRQVRDSVAVNVSRDISPKLTLRGGVRAYSTQALDSSETDFVERDYLQIRGTARWNISRKLSFEFDYRYTDIARELQGVTVQSGDSNQIGIYVNWHPNPL